MTSVMTSAAVTELSSIIDLLSRPGTTDEIEQILETLSELKADTDLGDAASMIWIAELKELPLKAIYDAARKFWMSKKPFMPLLGEFHHEASQCAERLRIVKAALEYQPPQTVPSKYVGSSEGEPATRDLHVSFHEPKLKQRDPARIEAMKAATTKGITP